MKSIFCLILFFSSQIVFGQQFNYRNGDIVYELTVSNDHLSKSDLFNITNDFLNNTLNKGSVFIQSENFDSGLIVAGELPLSMKKRIAM